MTSRPPTDDAGAARYEPDPHTRGSSPPGASRGSSGRFDWFDGAPTEVDSQPGFAIVEPATTDVDPVRYPPIRVISMKDRDDGKTRFDQPRVPLHVQLRSLAELSVHGAAQRDLGHLAPPRDPRQARVRQIRRYALRAGVALGLATLIAFAIWLAAGR